MAASPPCSPIPSFRRWKAHPVFELVARSAVVSSWGVNTKNVTIWECPVSGLRFRRTEPHEQLSDYYTADYHEKMTGHYSTCRSRAYQKENKSRLDYLRRFLQRGRVLDVGCSHGGFAQAMNRAGLDAYGLDISPQACEKSKLLLGDDHVYEGLLEEWAPKLQLKFSAVTMMDVIEHCVGAVSLLRAAYAVLEPRGILFLRTPTLSSPFHFIGNLSYRLTFGLCKTALFKLYHAEHLYFFSEYSIRRLLDDCGFDTLEVAPDPLCWENFRTAELQQGPMGNLLLSGVYFVGRAFGRGHGMKVVARRRESSNATDWQP